MIPKIALDYIKNKKLTPGFSYKDVWHEEHATGFTVAKAMQLDILADIFNAVTAAIENGQAFDTFKRNIKPILKQKEWWGDKNMTDPITGSTVKAKLGSDRRLKTIYHVNMRSAYQKGMYERAMKSDVHPYFLYRIGPSANHRDLHRSWDGLVLPKNDPFWDAHFPPKGWGCKCYTRAITEARKKIYEQTGLTVPPRADGTGGGTVQIKTQAPPEKYTMFYNERKQTFEKVPEGVDPAFNWHIGKAARDTGAKKALQTAQINYNKAVKTVPNLTNKERISDMQKTATKFFKTLSAGMRFDIDNYSCGDGADLNSILYKLGTNWKQSPEASLIQTLDTAIEKYPRLNSETFFFKGDNARHWENWTVGTKRPLAGFFSTSVRKNVAERYATDKLDAGQNPIMVVIKAPVDTKGLYIGNNTAYPNGNEYEFLFPRNTVFNVLEKDEHHILLEAVK